MASKKSEATADKGVKQCPIGTVLFHEGDEGDRMYVIKSGRVQISKRVVGTTVVVEELGAGEFCGELSLVNGQARPVSATVIVDASVIQIDATQFESMLKNNSDIALRMLKKMSQRLTQAQYRISNLILRTSRARVLHQLLHEVRSSPGFAAQGVHSPTPIPDNLPEVLAIEMGEIKDILNQLVRDDMISLDREGYFQIQDAASLERYLQFLELHDRFDHRAS